MKNAGTLLLVASGIGAAVWYFAKKASAHTVEAGGRTWIVKPIDMKGAIGAQGYDVYAPAGSWGPHGEMLVLQYHHVMGPNGGNTLSGVGKDVPVAMRDAAMAAFNVTVPGA